MWSQDLLCWCPSLEAPLSCHFQEALLCLNISHPIWGSNGYLWRIQKNDPLLIFLKLNICLCPKMNVRDGLKHRNKLLQELKSITPLKFYQVGADITDLAEPLGWKVMWVTAAWGGGWKGKRCCALAMPTSDLIREEQMCLAGLSALGRDTL